LSFHQYYSEEFLGCFFSSARSLMRAIAPGTPSAAPAAAHPPACACTLRLEGSYRTGHRYSVVENSNLARRGVPFSTLGALTRSRAEYPDRITQWSLRAPKLGPACSRVSSGALALRRLRSTRGNHAKFYDCIPQVFGHMNVTAHTRDHEHSGFMQWFFVQNRQQVSSHASCRSDGNSSAI
jgi:hypothetical protein